MNRIIPRISTIAAVLLGAGMQLAGAPAVAVVTLPTADCGLGPTNNCLQFGDFTVYSLPLLTYYQNTPSTPLSSSLQGLDLSEKTNEATVDIVSTNAPNGTNIQGTGTLIDNPYDAYQGSQQPGVDNNLRFLMSTALSTGQFAVPSDPAGGPAADNLLQSATTVNNTSTYTSQAGSFSDPTKYDPAECFNNLNGCLPLWDTDVASLRTALGDQDLVFFFVNNETGNSGDLLGQDLDAWARVCLSDTATGGKICFTLDGTGVDVATFASDAQVTGESDILPTADDLWAHVHSDICVADGSTGEPVGQVIPGKCQDIGVGGTSINQSLGQDTATFAVFNSLLSSLVKDPNSIYDVMTVDFRMAYLNDGGDVLWIGAANVIPTTPVPEPQTLMLVGLALAGMGIVGWRRRRTLG